jgi:hypothetical protein
MKPMMWPAGLMVNVPVAEADPTASVMASCVSVEPEM